MSTSAELFRGFTNPESYDRDEQNVVSLAQRQPEDRARGGGDFAEVVRSVDGTVMLLLGDASAKGDVGRQHASFLLQSYRKLSSKWLSPAIIVAGMREDYADFLWRDGNDAHFASILVATFLPTGITAYACAGGPGGILLRRNGKLEQLPATGGLVGVAGLAPCAEASFVLRDGDLVAAFTDGASEARAGWGDESLLGVQGIAHLMHPAVSATSLIAGVAAFNGDRFLDDATVAVVRMRRT